MAGSSTSSPKPAPARATAIASTASCLVPDPASRFQPEDVDGPSEVIDPARIPMARPGVARPAVERGGDLRAACRHLYPRRTLTAAAIEKLSQLVDLGITAIELMPLSDFAGKRNWGYDGVLPYAPDSAYGRPEDLKALIDAAHGAGLMVLLDVVYNHFGPKGNYLPRYAPQFFTDRHKTPWGAAIDFSNEVRKEILRPQRALLARGIPLRRPALRRGARDHRRVAEAHPGRDPRRAFRAGKHLVLENDANQARFIGPQRYTAQWNDDSHHGYHVLATGESDGYYVAYADAPAKHLARCLAEGFAYQGEESPFSKEPRGEPSAPPAAVVLRRLPAEPRPGRQSRFWGKVDFPLQREEAQSVIGHPTARAIAAAALHGRGVGLQAAVPLLLRFRRRARRGGAQGPARGVQPLCFVQELHSGSAGREHVQAMRARTGSSATKAGSRTTASSCSCARAQSHRATSAPGAIACSASARSR